MSKLTIALILTGILLLGGTGLYAAQLVQRASQHARPPRTTDVAAIEDWMTVRYVARSYGVPEQVLIDTLKITPEQARRQSLAAIAREQRRPPEQELAQVRSVVAQYQTAHPNAAPPSRLAPRGGG
jgi:hypothetical protein